jgi:hypothetical protein
VSLLGNTQPNSKHTILRWQINVTKIYVQTVVFSGIISYLDVFVKVFFLYIFIEMLFLYHKGLVGFYIVLKCPVKKLYIFYIALIERSLVNTTILLWP